MEFVVEELGHTGEQHHRQKVGAQEGGHQQHRRRCSTDFAKEFPRGELGGFGACRAFTLWLDQIFAQRQSEGDSQGAEHHERPAPSVVLRDQSGEEAAGDGPHVDAGLVKAKGSRSRFLAMVIADQRHGGREVERFAQTFGRPKKEQVAEVARERRGHADHAPGLESAQDRGLAADPVDDGARQRRREPIHPGERRAEQAQLDGSQMHLPLEQREHGEDRLAVRVVKERDPPQHGDYLAFIVEVWQSHKIMARRSATLSYAASTARNVFRYSRPLLSNEAPVRRQSTKCCCVARTLSPR